MELEVYKKDGTKSGERVKLSADIFGIEPNEDAMFRAVRVYLDNQRQGTSKVKTREEVRGGGKSPSRSVAHGSAPAVREASAGFTRATPEEMSSGVIRRIPSR